MARLHTLEDDITFERVRSMPKRTRVCSIHRQLSWACNKEVQIYEKGAKVTMSGLDRSKSAMQGRFRELRTLQRKLSFNKAAVLNRRASCPAVLLSDTKKQMLRLTPASNTSTEVEDGGHHVTDKDVIKGNSVTLQRKALPRSVSINVKFDAQTKKTDNSDKQIGDSIDDDVESESPRIPDSVLQRRKTMPNL